MKTLSAEEVKGLVEELKPLLEKIKEIKKNHEMDSDLSIFLWEDRIRVTGGDLKGWSFTAERQDVTIEYSYKEKYEFKEEGK